MSEETVTRAPARFLRPPEQWKPSVQDAIDIDFYFPPLDPGIEPHGDRVIFQLRSPICKTRSGLIIPDEAQDFEQFNEQVARVISIGPLAFHFQKDGKPWPEGEWFTTGDFVRIPQFGSEKWEVTAGDNKAIFVCRAPHNVIGRIYSNPLNFKSYLSRDSEMRNFGNEKPFEMAV